jgi:hypothetical protein
MSVRPNIQSLKLEGKDLVVLGESDTPLPALIQVVVVQEGATEEGRGTEVGGGPVDRVGSGWRATLSDTAFKTGPAEAMGVEIRVTPFEITSWVQSVTIA